MSKNKNTEPCLRDRDADDAIVVLCVGHSEEDIEALLRKYPSWYRSEMLTSYYFDKTKHTKYESNITLMQRLLNAGYPREEMFSHLSDLYVYVTEITTSVISAWCRERGYNRERMCPIFKDRITGRRIYDCAFAYDPFWDELTDKEIDHHDTN